MSAGPRRALSLRARVTAGLGVVAVVLVAVLGIITVTGRAELMDQVDARLRTSSPGGRGEREPAGDHREGREDGADGVPERASDVYEGTVGSDGQLVTRFSPNVGDRTYAPPAVEAADLPAEGSATFTVDATDGATTYRVLAQRTGDTVTITAIPIDDVQATSDRLLVVTALGSLAALAALGLVGWWVVHLGIRPVQDMTRTATRIAEGDLDVRVPEAAPGTESGALAVALNRMVGNLTGALSERAASEERLRRFVADASHELRTPLTTIRGYAELYRHGALAAPEALDDAMRRTEQETLRMGRLVEDMLVLAKLDEDRPLTTAPVDLLAVARDAAADARAVAPDRTVTFDDGALTEGAAVVDGDEDRLRQVVANVVGNALVHTEPGVPITVAVRREPGTVVLAVHDEGAGMAPEVVARVTERFFRADPSRSRHRGGSGLGLAIVDAAVTAHGGTVEIESAPGAGTTVRLRLPVRANLG